MFLAPGRGCSTPQRCPFKGALEDRLPTPPPSRPIPPQVGEFLILLSEKRPKLLASHLSLLLPHLETGDCFMLRNALVTVIARLVVHVYSDAAAVDNHEAGGVSSFSDGAAGGGVSGMEGGAEEGDGGNGEGGELSMRNDAKMRRVRGKQELLGLLLERVRDTSAHVRSRVLATWAWLCQQKAVPLGHWNAVTQLAVGRLQDKSSIVRKSALQVREGTLRRRGGERGLARVPSMLLNTSCSSCANVCLCAYVSVCMCI